MAIRPLAFLQFLLILAFMSFIGLLVHEFGHAAVAAAQGADVTGVWIYPGIELYPDFGASYPYANYPNAFGKMEYFGGTSDWAEANYGFVSLMGAGSTLIFSLVGLALLWLIRPRRRWLRFTLIALALWYMDMFTYTIFPSLDIRHWIVIGGRSAEPLRGAVRMGISQDVFITFVLVVSLIETWALVYWMRRYWHTAPPENPEVVALASA